MPLKKLMFLSILFFISSSSFAQNFKLWDLGVRAGLTYSAIQYTAEDTSATGFVNAVTENIEYKPGFSVGVYSDFFRNKNIYLGVGADYYQKGYKSKVIVTNDLGQQTGTGHFNYRLDYLTFSFYAKFNPNVGKINPFFIIAPRVDYYMGYSISSSIPGFDSNTKNNIFEQYKKITGSVSIGAGVEIFGILKNPVLVEFTFVPDLINQFNNGFVSIKNKSFGLSAGLQF